MSNWGQKNKQSFEQDQSKEEKESKKDEREVSGKGIRELRIRA